MIPGFSISSAPQSPPLNCRSTQIGGSSGEVDEYSFKVDLEFILNYFLCMNAEQSNSSENDSKTRLLELLRARAAGSIGPCASPDWLPNVEKLNVDVVSDVPGFQPLAAGTEPAQSRYEGGTKAVQTQGEAGTSRHPIESPTGPKPASPRKSNPATHSKLDDLPPEVLAKIIHLLETKTFDAAVLEVTSAEPYGLGIKTSRSSLERLFDRHRTAQLVRDEEESTTHILDLAKNSSASEEQISRTTIRFLRHRLLKKSMSNRSSSAEILALAKSLDRLQAVDLAERRLRLAEARIKLAADSPDVAGAKA